MGHFSEIAQVGCAIDNATNRASVYLHDTKFL